MTRIHVGNPLDVRPARGADGATGAVVADGTADGTADWRATAAAIVAASGSITRAAWARVVPQDWQNVRVAGLAIPQDGQRIRPAAGSAAGGAACEDAAVAGPACGGQIGSDGTISGISHVAGGTLVTAIGGLLPAGPGPAALAGPAAGSAIEPGSAGCPSHSRNAPHDPQNSSPAVLAVPHRRQMIDAASGTCATPA